MLGAEASCFRFVISVVFVYDNGGAGGITTKGDLSAINRRGWGIADTFPGRRKY